MTEWTQVLAIAGVNATLFGTMIGMLLHQDKKIESHRLEQQSLLMEQRRELNEHRKETNEILREIKDEQKEFHARLYGIEDNKRQRDKK